MTVHATDWPLNIETQKHGIILNERLVSKTKNMEFHFMTAKNPYAHKNTC